jgi:hypothetical protein
LTAPYDRILAADFETAWCSKTYTLSKMTAEEYVRDPRFKAWGLCWKEIGVDHAPIWVRGNDIAEWAASVDWSRTAVLAHNAQFDITILSWRYGVQPAFIFDTLSMARALRGIEVGNSLAKLAEDFGLPPKGKAVHSTDGMLDSIPFEVEIELADYCRHDTWLCEQLFLQLIQGYPTKELRLIDMTMQMYTHPLLRLDKEMLQNAIEEEKTAREDLLQRAGVEEAALASNQKFAEVLASLGATPPTKTSKTTGENTFAFAKNDALFQALFNSDNEDIALICEARLRVKSTSERTRAQRFVDIASRGSLPVPLSYYGAGTGRWTACLVAETEVLVYDRHSGPCKKRIVDVLPDDLVWDGVEFVQHEGVQFSGYKEVMTHDGITGTPDHKVFVNEDATLPLVEAAARGTRILDAAEPDGRALEAARARLKRLGW